LHEHLKERLEKKKEYLRGGPCFNKSKKTERKLTVGEVQNAPENFPGKKKPGGQRSLKNQKGRENRKEILGRTR